MILTPYRIFHNQPTQRSGHVLVGIDADGLEAAVPFSRQIESQPSLRFRPGFLRKGWFVRVFSLCHVPRMGAI
jgi:hypothetical protein